MRFIMPLKPFVFLCFLGLSASAPARADIAGLISALVFGSAVVNGLDLGPSDLSKSQPSSQLAQSFRALSKAERRNVQRRLKELGFYDRSVDGLWGTGTLAALRRYASSRGLSLSLSSSSDARRVLNRLRSVPSSSRTASTAAPAPSAPTAPVTPLLETGLSRYQIRNIQLWLSASGYDAGPVDGLFGKQSQRAADTYLAVRGLSLDSLSLEDLHDMLEKSLDALVSKVERSPAFLDYKELDETDLSLELARRAFPANSDIFEDEAALWHWIEQEFPRDKYGPGQELANSLTEAYYNGSPEEKSDAAALLRRLIQANVTTEPLQFVIRDKVILQPINFVPGRGIPIHDAALGTNNFLPYGVGLRVLPIEPVMAQAKFYNDTELDLGYLPVDQARTRAIERLLINNPEYRFEMLSFVRLEGLSKSMTASEETPVFEAHASFDGFALIVTPESASTADDETTLYQWQNHSPSQTPKGDSGFYSAETPSISVVKSTL